MIKREPFSRCHFANHEPSGAAKPMEKEIAMAAKVIRYHDPEWDSFYAREASRLDAVFDDSLQ